MTTYRTAEFFSQVNETGNYHREDGPAVEYHDGSKKFWYRNGLLHRVDGPAYTSLNVSEWYQFGEPHRLDGPAVIWENDEKHWWVNGTQVTKDLHLFDTEEGRLQLALKYGVPRE